MFTGPKSQGNGRQIVDDRDGMTILGQVDGADVAVASVASFHADLGELLSQVHGELAFGFLAASRTEDTAKLPFAHAQRTEEKAFAAVAFGSKHTQHGRGTAERAYTGRGDGWGSVPVGGEEFGVGLQKGPEDEFG